MSEAVTDRTAYRVECFIVDGVSQVSFSGFFDPGSSLADKDRIVDELMAVAERQRAKHICLQLEAEKAGKQRVVDQEKERLGKILADAEVQRENGGLQDATSNAMRAAQQNVERRQEEVMLLDAKLESIKPMLREQPTEGS